ncbi:hypothetical protein [Variovorax saccharolyticus]|uniref:hypothetical protein n=1 Tax=Variovorax saccharolyticus TaxID=3053516 RepID=UPI002577941D|nr:hypothetical protein [Variovorax sp. J31P216]MDM0030413.1 hypothetical protein [Variovorax sp. J31P216]
MDQLREASAFITPELVEDAQTYLQIHPKMGRPRKADDTPSKRNLVSRKVMALPTRP